jgi:hypothetical protein
MKFTVLGSNQRKAVEFGLDLKDLVIIEWMQKFWPKMKKKIIDGKEYGWVKYDALLKDYPLLEINAKKVLYRRMKAMEDLEILDHRGVKDETGSFSYYRLTEKVLELIDDEYSDGGGTEKSHGKNRGGTFKSHGSTEKSQDSIKESYPVVPKGAIKDLITNNLSIKSFISLPSEEKKKILKEVWEEKKFRSSQEKYFIFREKTDWAGIKKLEADILWWENGHKEKFSHLHQEKIMEAPLKKKSLSEIEKEKDLENIRASIKGLINRASRDGYWIYHELFANGEIIKTSEGFSIFVSSQEALKFQELLEAIYVKIEIIQGN